MATTKRPIDFFGKARAGFLDLGDRVTAALTATDLAILCHAQSRFQEVVALTVTDVIPVLAEARLDDETAVALRLLQEGAAAEAVTLAVLRKARAALRAVAVS
jgi:hypothetical protein